MYFIGDTHGLRPIFDIIDRKKLEGKNLIHVGDLGLGFVSILQDVKNLDLLDQALINTNNKLYVIRGNHDNPIFWKKSRGLNLLKLHNVHLVDDYSVKKIEDKNVLFAGGAISIDRRPRMDDVPYPTWWEDEVFEYDPLRLDKAISVHKNIDIVVTHTAPDFCYPQKADGVDIVEHYHSIEAAHNCNLKAELAAERQEVTQFYNDLVLHHKMTPTYWFYGHFHSSKSQKINGTTFKLLNINEVDEVK